MKDALQLITAVVAGALGVVSILISTRGNRRLHRETAEREAQDRSRVHLERFQEPLVRAAYDLQSRFYNIACRGLLQNPRRDASEPSHYNRESTAWLIGQYFGWLEILRREAQFLALPSMPERQRLQSALERVARAFSSDSVHDDLFRVFRSEQRALGEVMTVDHGRDALGNQRTDCLGYAAFVERLSVPGSQVHRWFSKLGSDVDSLRREPYRSDRLVAVQHALMDLIDILDPQGVRFPENRSRA